jgi:biopolymer transport protein ExbB/TolQ
MIKMFVSGGYWMWVILIIAITNIVLTIKNAIEIRRAGTSGKVSDGSGINAIMFWGGIGAAAGFLAQITGIYLGINAILAADDISLMVVAKGLACALTPTIFGLWVFILSALAWFLLRIWFRAVAAKSAYPKK